jgi:acetylornithine deacetylase/succinyl-diaminopimelate desuccinylase-like protein
MPSMPTLPSHVDILRTLVGTPSVSSPDPSFDQSNRAVVDHLAELCEQLGFRVEVVPLERSPHKANLIATLGPADQPGGLVFSGHTDTVPYDRDQWHTDPFTLTQRDDGSLYGLGVADMKGFFPCALHAVRTLGAGALRKPVVLVATADEESTMWGAQQLVSEGRRLGRHAIIGEPTGMRPVRKHKGVMMERVLLEGSAGHSSDPSLGRNAIEGMGARDRSVGPRARRLRGPLPRRELQRPESHAQPGQGVRRGQPQPHLRALRAVLRRAPTAGHAARGHPRGALARRAGGHRGPGPERRVRGAGGRCAALRDPCGLALRARLRRGHGGQRPSPSCSAPRRRTSPSWAWRPWSWGQAASRWPISPTRPCACKTSSTPRGSTPSCSRASAAA